MEILEDCQEMRDLSHDDDHMSEAEQHENDQPPNACGRPEVGLGGPSTSVVISGRMAALDSACNGKCSL